MNSSYASPQRMYLSSVSNEIISAETWTLDKEISYSVERNDFKSIIKLKIESKRC